VEQRALDLRAAGVPGTLRELRVRAYLDLLQERDCRHAPDPGAGAAPDPGGPGSPGNPDGPGSPERGPAGGPGLAAMVTITVPLAALQGDPTAPGEAAEFLRSLRLTLNPVIRGPCPHAQAKHRYRPGRKLRHLVNVRNTRCTAPGCGQPAARCDLDHTAPWHHGGSTCPCNLAPSCRG
jgi:hypothetical protein